MKTIIYYLHRGNNIPFYIGKTKNSSKKRQGEHRNKLNNKNIYLEIVDEVSNNEWKFWEQHYISLFKSWGFKLDNKNKGGGGSSFRDQEFKDKSSKQRKGKKRPEIKKPILQFDLKGNFIKEWESYSHAYNIFKNQGISKAARGENLQASGCIWCYKKDYTPNLILDKINKLENSTIPIIQFDTNMNFINEYLSIQSASKSINKKPSAICECCKGKRKVAYGYIWKYKNELHEKQS
jgi:hypothetical protein